MNKQIDFAENFLKAGLKIVPVALSNQNFRGVFAIKKLPIFCLCPLQV